MKKLAISILLLACVASPALAVERLGGPINLTGRYGINGNVGILFPIGDLGDTADTSVVFGGKFLYGLRNNFMIEGNLSYSPLSEDEDLEALGIDPDLSVLELSGGLRYLFPSRGQIVPYLSGALGIYRTSGEEVVRDIFGNVFLIDADSTDVGINFGGGLLYFFNNNTAVDAEGKFHISEPDYFGMTGGLTYFFR